MRLQAVFRIRLIILQMIRTLRRFTITFLVLGVLFVSLLVGKDALLNEVRKQVETTFSYESLRLTAFPPALLAENIQSHTTMPFFKARSVRVEIPYVSLLRKNRAIIVVVDGPEIRLSPEAFRTPRTGRRRSIFPLPFVIERGIIRNGEFFFRDEEGLVRIQGLMALFTQRGEDFALRAEAGHGAFTSFSESLRIGGRLTLSLSGRGENLEISRITLEGPELVVKGDGSLRNIRNPEFDIETRFEVETAFALPMLDIPFGWEGKVSGRGTVRRRDGEVRVDAELDGDRIDLNGIPMGRISGRFRLDGREGGRLDFDIRKPDRLPEVLSLSFKGGRLEGVAEPVFLDPIMREIDIPWPVKSPVWGTFSLQKRKLEARAELRDEALAPIGGLYGLRGKVAVNVDFREDDILVATDDLESGFARLEARMRYLIGKDMDVVLRGSLHDVKESRKFLAVILGETFALPEIRGAGYADIRLKGLPADLTISSSFSLSPGGYDLFNAEFVKGDVLLDGGVFHGDFHVSDPDLNGDIRVIGKPEGTEVTVGSGEGDLETVFAALRIPASFRGRFGGDFRMIQAGDSQVITGSFTSPSVEAFGLKGTDVSGDLEWNSGILFFPRLGFELQGGRVEGRFLLGTVNREFDMDIRGEGIDLSTMDPDLKGKMGFTLAGRGVFGRQVPTGRILIEGLTASPLRDTELAGDVSMDYLEDRIELDVRGVIRPGQNEFNSLFRIPLGGEPFTGEVKGRFTNLDLVLPWAGVKGALDYTAQVTETEGPPRISVVMDMKGPLMPMPGFAHALTDYTASAEVDGGRLTLTSFTGKLGGGDVRGAGLIGLGESGVVSIDITAEGKDMLLSPVERMRGLVDGTARLVKDSRTFVLEGDFLFKRLSWRREIYERFELSSSAGLYETKREPSFFDGLTLNLRLRAEDNVSMQNSLGQATGRFDLSLSGNMSGPVLLGDIDLLGGDIYFQDRTFRIIYGRLSFFNPVSLEPYLDLRGETYVRDYRVTMNINGPAGRIRPEFAASPPLAPDEVLSLLALGETFRRTYYSYSHDRNTTLSTASLLSFQIADQAKKRTEGLFSLDRFRIDPYVPEQAATEIAARITVGKKISKNLLFIYSTLLASSTLLNEVDEVPIFRMEWDVSRDFSLVGGRDDRGKLSFDVKFRKRF